MAFPLHASAERRRLIAGRILMTLNLWNDPMLAQHRNHHIGARAEGTATMSNPYFPDDGCIAIPWTVVRVVVVIYVAVLLTAVTSVFAVAAAWGPAALEAIAGLLAAVTAAASLAISPPRRH